MTDERQRDEGFTLVEVVFAVVIFFIGFMAIMTLMETNMISSAKAKQKAAVVNAAAGYIDQLRSRAYADITTGTVVEPDMLVDRYRVQITRTVESQYGAGTDWKVVRLTITGDLADSPGRMPMTYSTSTIISQNDFNRRFALPPTVVFHSPSEGYLLPATGSVAVDVEVHARGMGVTLSEVSFLIDGNQQELREVASQTVLVDDFTLDVTSLSIGLHTLRIEAKDSNGNIGWESLTVQKTDASTGTPPNAPNGLFCSQPNPATHAQVDYPSMSLVWNAPVGGTPVDHYVLSWSQNGVSQTDLTVAGTALSASVPVTSFSKCDFQLVAYAADGAASAPAQYSVMTLPALSATSSTSGSNRTVVFTLEAPRFDCTYSVTLYVSSASSMASRSALSSASGIGRTPWQFSTVRHKNDTEYFQAVVAATPSGSTTALPSAYSDVVGPSNSSTLKQTW